MKDVRSNSLGWICLFLFVIVSCSDDEPSFQELAEAKLLGTWEVRGTEAIKLDGLNITANYPNFSLVFRDDFRYSSFNGGGLFSANGTWKSADSEARQIVFDEDIVANVSVLNETQLTFSFTNYGGNEAAGLSGSYVVTLIKAD